MSSSRAVRAARAFAEVYIDDSKFRSGIARMEKRFKRFGAGLRGIGAKLFAGGATITAPFVGAIKSASDYRETLRKLDKVFGDGAWRAKEWADGFADAIGEARADVTRFIADTQDFVLPMGFPADEATDFSQRLITLAADLGALNNTSTGEVLKDLQSALSGSSETMEKYGANLKVAAVNQELMSKGIDPSNANRMEEALARLSIMTRETSTATGAAKERMQGFAGQMSILKAEVSNVATQIGSTLLPVVTPLVTRFARVVKGVREWIKQNPQLVLGVGAAGVAITALGAGLVTAGTVVGALGTLIGTLGSVVSAVFVVGTSPIGLAVAAVGALGAAWLDLSDNGQDLVASLKGTFSTFAGDVSEVFGGISDAISTGNMEGAMGLIADAMERESLRIQETLAELMASAKEAINDSAFLFVLTKMGKGEFGNLYEFLDPTASPDLAEMQYEIELHNKAQGLKSRRLEVDQRIEQKTAQLRAAVLDRQAVALQKSVNAGVQPATNPIGLGLNVGVHQTLKEMLRVTEENRQEIAELNRKTGATQVVHF